MKNGEDRFLKFQARKTEILKNLAKQLQNHFILVVIGSEGQLATASTLQDEVTNKIFEKLIGQTKTKPTEVIEIKIDLNKLD